MEQRSKTSMLQLPVMQGGFAGQYQERLEEGGRSQHHNTCCFDSRVLGGMLCIQKQPRGQL